MADEPEIAPTAKPNEEAKAPTPPDALGLTAETPKEGEATPEAKPADATKEEKVEYNFNLPDGWEVDETKMNEFKSMAAEQKLAPEAAQKFMDRYISDVKAAAEEPVKVWVDTQKQWVQEVQKDPEIGGDNLPAVRATMAKALDQFGTPEAREALILTGAGNNPAIIKMFYRMAKELTEGGAGPQGNPAKGQKSAAERFYPNLPAGET